jgi:cytochrome c peroxidase
MGSALAICDLESGEVTQLPLDDPSACFADPSAVVVDRDGTRAYVAAGGADAISVIDVERLERSLDRLREEERPRAGDDLQLAADYVRARIPTGPNPRHLALSPDGSRLYVAEHLGDAIAVVDTASASVQRRFRLRDDLGDDPVWRGARVFAAARTSFHGQFSCRSCHPDGHVDGLAYDFDIDGVGRNIVDNRSLRGVGGSAPFKWNGKNPSLEVQCGMRFAKVLTRTEAISGRELEDLAAYIRSLPPMPPERPGSAEARERGRRLFFASHAPDGTEIPPGQRCATCHPPPLYTNGLASSVGSGGASDDHEAFDVPHLLGIAASAPYLHDGRAATLEEIWTVYNPDDTHGITNSYSKHDLNDLVEFLRSL